MVGSNKKKLFFNILAEKGIIPLCYTNKNNPRLSYLILYYTGKNETPFLPPFFKGGQQNRT